MTRARLLSLLGLAFAAALFVGCATDPGYDEQLESTKFTIENTGKFVLLDPGAQESIRCTGLQERILPDGRLEVVANVKNRENRRIHVQVNCVFKDEQGTSIGDEAAFQSLTLIEYATEAVQFTSVNSQARKYTIGVREGR